MTHHLWPSSFPELPPCLDLHLSPDSQQYLSKGSLQRFPLPHSIFPLNQCQRDLTKTTSDYAASLLWWLSLARKASLNCLERVAHSPAPTNSFPRNCPGSTHTPSWRSLCLKCSSLPCPSMTLVILPGQAQKFPFGKYAPSSMDIIIQLRPENLPTKEAISLKN